jgi:hypothetical protein
MKKILLIVFLFALKGTNGQTVKPTVTDSFKDLLNSFLEVGYATIEKYHYYFDTAKLKTCALVSIKLKKNGAIDSVYVLGDNSDTLKIFLKETFAQLVLKKYLFKPYFGKTLIFPVTLMLYAGRRFYSELPDNCWNSLISAFHTKGEPFFPGAQFKSPQECILFNTLFLKYPEGYH